MLFLVILNIGISIVSPTPSPFPLSAIAGKPGGKRLGKFKMTTNDDIFATALDRISVISIGYGVLGIEK